MGGWSWISQPGLPANCNVGSTRVMRFCSTSLISKSQKSRAGKAETKSKTQGSPHSAPILGTQRGSPCPHNTSHPVLSLTQIHAPPKAPCHTMTLKTLDPQNPPRERTSPNCHPQTESFSTLDTTDYFALTSY